VGQYARQAGPGRIRAFAEVTEHGTGAPAEGRRERPQLRVARVTLRQQAKPDRTLTLAGERGGDMTLLIARPQRAQSLGQVGRQRAEITTTGRRQHARQRLGLLCHRRDQLCCNREAPFEGRRVQKADRRPVQRGFPGAMRQDWRLASQRRADDE
jgi:hypothetical protein